MDIQYVNRATGTIEIEKIYGHRAISLLYGDSLISRFFSFWLLPILTRFPLFSQCYGYLQRLSFSKNKIEPFIETYKVDRSEFANENFQSFNDFFIRKLKPECRPINQNAETAILPADGRYLVFPNLDNVKQFYIKGQSFDVPNFLHDSAYGRRYQSGSMVIARLCPSDYHRFHFPVDGVPSLARDIPGALFSVNPMALKKRFSIFWENHRMVTEINAGKFGTVLYVEVGATCVGTIHQTYQPEKKVQKGDEKGYFSFGGSCVVLLFEKGRISFDRDLIENTQRGLETKALFGQSLGQAN